MVDSCNLARTMNITQSTKEAVAICPHSHPSAQGPVSIPNHVVCLTTYFVVYPSSSYNQLCLHILFYDYIHIYYSVISLLILVLITDHILYNYVPVLYLPAGQSHVLPRPELVLTTRPLLNNVNYRSELSTAHTIGGPFYLPASFRAVLFGWLGSVPQSPRMCHQGVDRGFLYPCGRVTSVVYSVDLFRLSVQHQDYVFFQCITVELLSQLFTLNILSV